MKNNIVISAVNLTEAGPLSILKDCLSDASKYLVDRFNVIALVNDSSKLPELKGVEYIEYKLPKKSWLIRLFYEYFYFYFLSKRLSPYLWLSLHDITPNVKACKRAVYCHNASPFYKIKFKDVLLEPKFAVFNLFYKYLYKININNNDAVIVQQDWIRQEFKEIYDVNNIIVAHPAVNMIKGISKCSIDKKDHIIRFFYPSYARFFKNFEVICESAKLLNAKDISNFKVYLTIDGTENRYSSYILRKYNNIGSIEFIGRQSRQSIFDLYSKMDCLLFPSKLETWGLPITEFKQFNRPMILSDLPYAHETAGDYDKVNFFNPESPKELSIIMQNLIDGSCKPDKIKQGNIRPPFAKDWEGLFKILLDKQGCI